MSWKSALKKSVEANASKFSRPVIDPYKLDPVKVISLDTETYYDQDYTLRKLNTSSYVRDGRFKLQMVGVKEGRKPTKVMTEKQFKVWAKTVPWKDRALLCHHTHFDGFILSHHYGVVPGMYLDTLSMARGLHSNEVDGDLDSVAKFYGGRGKIEGILEKTKGVRDWSPALFKEVSTYCVQDVDEMHRIFWLMHVKMPAKEMELIDLIVRMFCDPVLKVNIPKVRAEYAREVAKRKELFFSAVTAADYEPGGEHYDKELHKKLIKGPAERALTGEDRDMLVCKRLLGNNEWFAEQLRKAGIEPAKKVSPAWMKAPPATRSDEDKYIYAFGKDDIVFTSLPEQHELWRGDLDPNKKADVVQIAAKKIHLEIMVSARLASKSTNNITRAERFIVAGDNGMSLPVGYAYSRAHTHRLGGSNKMNMQNLQRGGELRESIEAPPGYELAVCDSAQIEARMNAWFWEQDDLIEAFRLGRDIYSEFATRIYARKITKDDKIERFVGKTCLASDTRVFTNHGLKSIIDLTVDDLVWDGESWVQHDGLINQGIKEVQRRYGVAMTADHEILTERGWREWSEVHTDLSQFRSALSLASSLLSGGSTTPPPQESSGDTGLSAVALAELKTWCTPAASSRGVRPAAMPVPKLLQAQSATGPTKTLWPMTSTAQGCSIAYLPRLLAVATRTTQATSTMACAAFKWTSNGWQIARRSCDMYKHFLAGTIQLWKWIGKTLTGTTNPETFALFQGATILKTSGESKTLNNSSENSRQKTQVFDLANAGPNRRFTILTDAGPIIVHNCVLGLGFQMGAPKLQLTLAKGIGGVSAILTLNECHRIVNAYRSTYFKIRNGWAKCQSILEDMATGRTGSYKCISWEKETLWLPNGMCLKYPGLKAAINEETGWTEFTYLAKEVRSKIYGGLLCENIIQALARIVVMYQMLEINKKYRAVMTTHDEVVALAKAKDAEKCFQFMLGVMRTPPPWASGLPLNAEGGHAPNYSK